MKLSIPTTITVASSQIILGGVLLMMGNAAPIAMTTLTIISAGTIASTITSTLTSILK